MRIAAALGFVVMVCAASWLGCIQTEGVTTDTASTLPGPQPPDRCEPGTRPSLVSNTCEPVGPTTCARGFEPSTSGWGCSPILPATTCAGATRAALGETTCAPVDDCNRAFPPANADAVVHDDASLARALAGVGSGATIALESGTYGAIAVPADLDDVHLVGRCAEKVKVKGTSTRGIYVAGALKASVEAMTIEGFTGGIVAAWGANVRASRVVVRDAKIPLTVGGDAASLTIEDSVIERTLAPPAGETSAAMVAEKGGTLDVERTDVRGYEGLVSAFEVGTKVVARRSVFTSSGNSPKNSVIRAFASSDIRFDESALRFRTGMLAQVGRNLPRVAATANSAGASLHFTNSTVTQSEALLDAALGNVHDGGHVSLEGTTLEHQSFAAWMVGDATSSIETKDSVIRGLVESGSSCAAVWVLHGASAELESSAFVNAQRNALVVTHSGSRMSLRRSLVHDTLSAVSDTTPEFGAAGIGVFAGVNATLSIREGAFVSSRAFAILAAEGAQAEIDRTVIDATQLGPEGGAACGVGAFGARVVMEDSLVRRSEDAALAFVRSEGIVKHTRFLDNPIGVRAGETRIIEATEDPRSSAEAELVFFQNVFVGTPTLVRDAPQDAPTAPAPLGN